MEVRSHASEQLKQIALERLASTEPWDLCNEAKLEKCRATRDLRSCGRRVHHLLASCGHACLCIECSKRCDICPLCRTPISAQSSGLRLRLYDECVEAGLLVAFQEDEESRDFKESPYWTLDACRLCAFFDVAVDNSLASLVCHYVTDVCLDEGAVSSDPVISMLLDGTVVKEWCKRTLFATVNQIRDIYNAKASQLNADALDIHGRRLQAVSYVLEALEAPLDEVSPSYAELRQLFDSVRIVLQHLEAMTWCIRWRFLSNIQSCYPSTGHWRAAFHERKQAAHARVWPDCTSTEQTRPPGTLFIEDALNVGSGAEEELSNNSNGVLDLGILRQSSYSLTGSDYPPENTRTAVDLLFLEGSPDDFFAKTAIFLYYLFDRHWTRPEHEWRPVIDDYVLSFSIPRQSMLESFVYYLLDNSSDEALQEACRWLPEIVGPNLHPKIARVLLERGIPSAALSVLQSTGRYRPREESPLASVSIFDGVTVVRVLLECGLMAEAFLYQQGFIRAARGDSSGRDWLGEMDVLVGEICWFSIRGNCVVRMLELPWSAGGDEEKFLRKYLMEKARGDPGCSAGSLLMVFYLQRSRFSEAYSVHKTLYELEEAYISESVESEAIDKLRRICEQRTKLIEKALEALPEVQREQILSGKAGAEEPVGSSCCERMEMLPSYPGQDSRPLNPESNGSLFPAAPTNLLIHKTPAPVASESFLKSPAPRSGIKHSQQQQYNGTPATKTPQLMKSPLLPSPGASPLLGKRLRYENELRFFRQSSDPMPEFHEQPGHQQSGSKKDRSQAMVVTW